MPNYFGVQTPSPVDRQNRVQITATAGQTTLVVSYTPGYVDVYKNGTKLKLGVDFTATTGTFIVLTGGASAGDFFDVVAIKASSPYDFYTKAQIDAMLPRFFGQAGGTADALTVTTTPLVPALLNGTEICLRTVSTNLTQTPTLTLTNLGVTKTITTSGGQPVSAGSWGAGQDLILRYNSGTDKLEMVASGLGIATGNQVATGTATNVLVTPASLASGFIGLQSIGASGYQKLPGGLIIQWGVIASGGLADSSISFPIAFPNACRAVVANSNAVGLLTVNGSFNTTSFTYSRRANSTGTVVNDTSQAQYIAIGN